MTHTIRKIMHLVTDYTVERVTDIDKPSEILRSYSKNLIVQNKFEQNADKMHHAGGIGKLAGEGQALASFSSSLQIDWTKGGGLTRSRGTTRVSGLYATVSMEGIAKLGEFGEGIEWTGRQRTRCHRNTSNRR